MTSEQHQNNEGNGAEMCPAMLSGIVVFAKVDSDQSCSRFLSDELIIQGPHFPPRACWKTSVFIVYYENTEEK